jgi:hypothetical protein
MAPDVVREFIDQLETIQGSDSVDVLIHSTGGDGLTAWKLMSVLREKFARVSVLVPYMAFSAATLFSLGADDIFMHPYASLGPIDPQIILTYGDGSRRAFAYEDIGAFLRFLLEEVKISEQKHIAPITDKLFSIVDPLSVGGAKRASELSTEIGERLLLTHMTNAEDRIKARQIAENLNKSFLAHGYAVSRGRAREIGLRVASEDRDLEKLIWRAYLGLEEHMEMRNVFNASSHFLKDEEAAKSLKSRGPLNFPPNMPQELVGQILNAMAQQIIQESLSCGVEVRPKIIGAVVESPRLISEFSNTIDIFAYRLPTGEIKSYITEINKGWEKIPVPEPPPGLNVVPEKPQELDISKN